MYTVSSFVPTGSSIEVILFFVTVPLLLYISVKYDKNVSSSLSEYSAPLSV